MPDQGAASLPPQEAGTEGPEGGFAPGMIGDPPGEPTAELDLDSVTASSANSPVAIDLSTFSDLPSTDNPTENVHPFNIGLFTTTPGTYSDTFTLYYSDEQDLPAPPRRVRICLLHRHRHGRRQPGRFLGYCHRPRAGNGGDAELRLDFAGEKPAEGPQQRVSSSGIPGVFRRPRGSARSSGPPLNRFCRSAAGAFLWLHGSMRPCGLKFLSCCFQLAARQPIVRCCDRLESTLETIIIIVNHGSRISESNRMFEEVARRFAGKYEIVEPGHMELAEPSIATAYAAAVARGALDKHPGIACRADIRGKRTVGPRAAGRRRQQRRACSASQPFKGQSKNAN